MNAAFSFCLLLGFDARYANNGVRLMATLDLVTVFGSGEHSWHGERRVGVEGHADAGFRDLRNLEAGANLDDIMQWYDGLDREQVKAVIEFAARSLDTAHAFAP
jgi:hypothetical protein